MLNMELQRINKTVKKCQCLDVKHGFKKDLIKLSTKLLYKNML